MPHARRTDPHTSHEAAASQRPLVAEKQNSVLRVFQQFHPTPLSDEVLTAQCARLYRWPPHSSTARTRRAELAAMGYVESVGETRLTTGRKALVWRLTPAGKALSRVHSDA